MQYENSFPSIVDVEFTARCNLECGFCFGPVDDRSIPNLPTEFWIKALSAIEVRGAKGIVVSGGEPTLHPELRRLLAHAKGSGLSVVVSTHGRTTRRILEIVDYCDWIALPVDGVSEQMLSTMRGDTWGLTEAIALGKTLKVHNPLLKIKLGTVANKQNINEIIKLARFLTSNKVPFDTWKIYQYTPRRKFKERKHEYQILDKKYKNLCKIVSSIISKSDQFKVVFGSNKSRAAAYLFIYPDGTVAIPNIGPEMGDLTIGNMYHEGEKVLDRVRNINLTLHTNNYESTYGDAPNRIISGADSHNKKLLNDERI